jgi:hypothetical protein
VYEDASSRYADAMAEEEFGAGPSSDEFAAGWIAAQPPRPLTLFTDRFVIHATFKSHERRLSDSLNVPGEPFLVVEDARFEELGTRTVLEEAPFAQINLSTVLFAVAHEPAPAVPEMRRLKVTQKALVILPPFRIAGQLHLLPDRDLHRQLGELTGRFVPMTGCQFWAEAEGPRTTVSMVAFNHSRAQILAPYQERVAAED